MGNTVWNQCKDILTDNDTYTRLIYSGDIKGNKLDITEYKNEKKKNYIKSEGIKNPIIVVNRGYGIGKGLIALTLKKLIAADCQAVFLEVRQSNETAKAIYTKFGFSKIGVRPNYYSDNHEDAISMSLHNIQNAEFLSFLQSALNMLAYYRLSGN